MVQIGCVSEFKSYVSKHIHVCSISLGYNDFSVWTFLSMPPNPPSKCLPTPRVASPPKSWPHWQILHTPMDYY